MKHHDLVSFFNAQMLTSMKESFIISVLSVDNSRLIETYTVTKDAEEEGIFNIKWEAGQEDAFWEFKHSKSWSANFLETVYFIQMLERSLNCDSIAK